MTELILEQALQQAIDHHRAGRLPNAEHLYRAILKIQPNHSETNHNLGVLAVQIGQPAAALPFLKTALEANPEQGQYWLSYVETLLKVGQVDMARSVLTQSQALGLRGPPFDHLVRRVQCDQNEVALPILQKATTLNPQDPDIHNAMGKILYDLGRLEEALAHYERVVTIKPDDANAHYNLAVVIQGLGRLEEAPKYYAQALALKPDYAEAHNNLGNALRDLGRLEEALDHYERAVASKPDYAEAHNNLGNALRDLGRLEEAPEPYRRALRIKPDLAEVHNNLGNVLRDLGRSDEAMGYYQQALALKPDFAETHSNLAGVLIEFGQLDEARLHINQALKIMPNHLRARCLHTLLHKTIRDDPGFEILSRALLPDARVNPTHHLLIYFALGKMYEDIGEYDLAFKHYAAGNCFCTASHLKPYHAETDQRRLAFKRAVFTQKYFNERTQWGNASKLPIFIVGMPRSGTSLIEQILASHSQVHGAGELSDLSEFQTRILANKAQVTMEDFNTIFNEFDCRAIAETYLQHLRTLAPGAGYVTDKMPHNFEHLWLVALLFPRATVLHSVRDPIDTCLSCYFQDFKGDHAWSSDLRTLAQHYNYYHELMAHWQMVLPIRIHPIVYEDLVQDPEIQIPRLLNLCGLDFEPACLEFHRTQRSVKTASATQVKQKLYTSSIEKWRRYERHLGPLLETLDPAIFRRLKHHQDATQVIHGSIAFDPCQTSLKKRLVEQLLAKGDFATAKSAADNFLKLRRKSPQFALCIEVARRNCDYDTAYQLSEEFLATEPDNVLAFLSVAIDAEKIHKIERGVEALTQGLQRHPVNLNLYQTLLAYLIRNEQSTAAITATRQFLSTALGQTPEGTKIGVNVLIETGQLGEAITLFETAIQRYPSHRCLWDILYNLYRRMGKHTEAHYLLHKSLSYFPKSNNIYQWIFGELVRFSKLDDAKTIILEWEKTFPERWEPQYAKLKIAQIIRDIGQFNELAANLLIHWPSEPELMTNLAKIYSVVCHHRKAIELAERSVALSPDNIEYLLTLISLLATSGDFDQFEDLLGHVEKLLGGDHYLVYGKLSFFINCHPYFTEQKIYQYYVDFGKRGITPNLPPQLGHRNSKDLNRRLKIGYVSPDFKKHAAAYFTEPFLIEHDREQFELYAFSTLDPGQEDECTERFKSYCHHWIDISDLSPDEFVIEVRKHEIDILIDLAGHTAGSRVIDMARKPAPLQASWVFGASQTTGIEQIDYLIADKTLIPVESEKYCTEKVVRIDWKGYCYRPPDKTPPISPPPCLKAGVITFGTFVRPIRLCTQVFSVWARITNALPNCILRLDHIPYAETETQILLRERYQHCGGNPDQLRFASTHPHWNAFAEVDIVLDTFPTGSATTATEALWMGVPVVTLESRPMMGRSTLAQIDALGFANLLVAATEDDYVEKALALARNHQLLIKLRSELREVFLKSPLMAYKEYAVKFARLYRELWQNWCTQEPQEPSI
ncbi:protein O-GlcNAc transferase [Gammaproteobacteria bacterium]